MRNFSLFAAASGIAVLSASSAFAQVAGTATTDLNLRAGPSPAAEVVDVIPADGAVAIDSCLEDRNWCEVTYDGNTGYAYAQYLLAEMGGETVVVRDNINPLGIVVGAFTGTVDTVTDTAGTLIRGTADTIAGVIDPPEERVVYVRENRLEPVYFNEEVVVGDGLPETVVVQPVPDYDYSYAYVNGQPVFVEPDTRRVVYVVR